MGHPNQTIYTIEIIRQMISQLTKINLELISTTYPDELLGFYVKIRCTDCGFESIRKPTYLKLEHDHKCSHCYEYTIEKIQEMISKLKKVSLELISTSYPDAEIGKFVIIRCTDCGIESIRSPSQLRLELDAKCKNCDAYTIEKIKKIISKLKKANYELLSTTYPNDLGDKNVEVKCKDCGNVSTKKVYHLQPYFDRKCQKCIYYTIEDIKKMIDDSGNNIKLISIIYPDDSGRGKTTVQCTDCLRIYTVYVRPGMETSCYDCTRRSKFSIDEVRNRIEAFGYKLISNTYEGSQKDLELQCKNGHLINKSLTALQLNQNCVDCNPTYFAEQRCRKIFESLLDIEFKSCYPKWLISNKGTLLQLDGYCESLKIAFEYQGYNITSIPHISIVKKTASMLIVTMISKNKKYVLRKV